MDIQTCKTCNEVKPVTEYYYNNKKPRIHCKKCVLKLRKDTEYKYYNKWKVSDKGIKWRQENKQTYQDLKDIIKKYQKTEKGILARKKAQAKYNAKKKKRNKTSDT